MIFSNLPKSFGQLADPNALIGNKVGMISYRSSWAATQPVAPAAITNNPLDGSFNWAFFDAAIAQARNYGLFASFHIGSNGPANQPSWVQANAVQFVGQDNDSMALPWDSYFQGALIAFLQALATRYMWFSNLYKVGTLIASDSNDWTFPSNTNANWQNSAAFTCPAYGSSVVVTTATNSQMNIGQVCFIPAFGWFQCDNAPPGPGPHNTKLLNLGTSGNANSGTVPINTTIQVSDVSNWQGPVYNYTTALLVSACNAITDAVLTAFPPNVQFQMEVGRNKNSLDIWPGGPAHSYNAATQIAQHGYGQYAVGRFAIDRDGFHPQTPTPLSALSSGENNDWFLLAETLQGALNSSGTTGVIPANSRVNGQWTWPVFDPTGAYTAASTNNYQANGGNTYGAGDVLSVFQAGLSICAFYNLGVIEIYEQDVINVMQPVSPPPSPMWGITPMSSSTWQISPQTGIINPGFNI